MHGLLAWIDTEEFASMPTYKCGCFQGTANVYFLEKAVHMVACEPVGHQNCRGVSS